MSFTQSVMSDGQFMFVPGTSEDSSIENSIDSTIRFNSLALLGNLYSTWPRPNHARAAWTRLGSRNESGTSSSPMMPSVEQSPQGALTVASVNSPSGIETSTRLLSRLRDCESNRSTISV